MSEIGMQEIYGRRQTDRQTDKPVDKLAVAAVEL